MNGSLEKNERNSSIDFLRIIAIIFVISGHFIIHNTGFEVEFLKRGKADYLPYGGGIVYLSQV